MIKIKRINTLEKIKESLPKFNGSKEEIELKTALYVYIKLGQLKNFDEDYYFGNSNQCKRIYEKSLIEAKNIEKIDNKRQLLCVTISSLYRYILKELGIEAISISEDINDIHVSNRVNLSNGKVIIADLQNDLINIKTKSKLKYFSFLDRNITEDEMTKLLIDVGYVNDLTEFNDYHILDLKDSISIKSPNEILDSIVNSKILDIDGIYGMSEVYQNVKNIFNELIPTKYKNKNLFIIPCEKYNKEKELIDKNNENNLNNNYTICLYSENNKKGNSDEDYRLYMYSPIKQTFLRADISTVEELKKNGFKIGKTEKEFGVREINKNLKFKNCSCIEK